MAKFAIFAIVTCDDFGARAAKPPRRVATMRVARAKSLAVVIGELQPQAVQALWKRARLASWLAKLAPNLAAARALYERKYSAMSRAIELRRAVVVTDPGRQGGGVVGLALPGCPGALHIPVGKLSLAASRIVWARLQEQGAPRRVVRRPAPAVYRGAETGGAA